MLYLPFLYSISKPQLAIGLEYFFLNHILYQIETMLSAYAEATEYNNKLNESILKINKSCNYRESKEIGYSLEPYLLPVTIVP